jgi:hypothetical protein
MIRLLFIALLLSFQPVSAQRELDIEFDQDELKDRYEINVLRFYLMSLQFHVSGCEWYAEENSVHLIDLEDASSWKIQLPKEFGKSSIDSISFLIGVDSTTNVAGILDGDLDPIKGMYWAWNSGYINFKVEGKKLDSETKFEYHLGGYLPPFSTARRVSLARNPQKKRMTLRLELKQFLDELDMKELTEVMIPGEEAVLLSDQLSNRFSFD